MAKPLLYLAALTSIIIFNSCTEEEPLEVVSFFNYNPEEDDDEIYPFMEAKYVIKATTEAPTISKIYLDGAEIELQSFNRNHPIGETTFTIIFPSTIIPDKVYNLEVITESGLVFNKNVKSMDFPVVMLIEIPDIMTPKRTMKFIIKRSPGWNHYKLKGDFFMNGNPWGYSKIGKIEGDTIYVTDFAKGNTKNLKLTFYKSTVDEEYQSLDNNFKILADLGDITIESLPSYEFVNRNFISINNYFHSNDTIVLAHYAFKYHSYLYKLEIYKNNQLIEELSSNIYRITDWTDPVPIHSDYIIYFLNERIPPGAYKIKVFMENVIIGNSFYAIPETTDDIVIIE